MKKIILFVVGCLLLAVSVKAQENINTVYHSQQSQKFYDDELKMMSTILYDSSKKSFTLREPLINDTLFIVDTSIHYIKIGDQVFFIKRTISLEPIEKISLSPNGRLIWGSGSGTSISRTLSLPTLNQ